MMLCLHGSVHSQKFVVLQTSVMFINYCQDEQSHVMLQVRVQAMFVGMLK